MSRCTSPDPGWYPHVHDSSFFRHELAALARIREEAPGVALVIPLGARNVLGPGRRLAAGSAAAWGDGGGGGPVGRVLAAGVLGLGVGGVSIGSNDLTQWVLGVDRNSAEPAALFDEADAAGARRRPRHALLRRPRESRGVGTHRCVRWTAELGTFDRGWRIDASATVSPWRRDLLRLLVRAPWLRTMTEMPQSAALERERDHA